MQVLVSPVITEKTLGKIADGVYAFEVNLKANKPQIADAIEKLYKVEVISVNILRVKGEEKTLKGKYKIKTRGIKKALITLKKGQKLPGFEEK